MKKLIYLIALTALITACGKDDETPNYIDKTLLIGEWEATGHYFDNNGNPIDFDKATSYEWQPILYNEIIKITEDTTCGFIVTVTNYNYQLIYSYNIVNDTLNLIGCTSDSAIYFICKIKNNNTLILADKGDDITYYNFYTRRQ